MLNNMTYLNNKIPVMYMIVDKINRCEYDMYFYN